MMNHLKELREKKGLNQLGLAMELNTTQSQISFLETGARTADAQMLINLAEFFDCSVDYLLDRSEIMLVADKLKVGSLSAEEIDFIQKLKRLSNADKNKLIGYLDSLLDDQQV